MIMEIVGSDKVHQDVAMFDRLTFITAKRHWMFSTVWLCLSLHKLVTSQVLHMIIDLIEKTFID
jgi:hypothetical protein